MLKITIHTPTKDFVYEIPTNQPSMEALKKWITIGAPLYIKEEYFGRIYTVHSHNYSVNDFIVQEFLPDFSEIWVEQCEP